MRQSVFGCLLVFIQIILLFYDYYKSQILNVLKTENENSLRKKRSSVHHSITPASSTLDYSGQYDILRFFKYVPVSRYWTFHDVTLVTQCSVNHLHYLIKLASYWSGRISCAVFTPDLDGSYASWAVDALRKCYPKLMRRVDFHFVYPQNHPADFTKFYENEEANADYNGFLESGNTCDDLLENIENYTR